MQNFKTIAFTALLLAIFHVRQLECFDAGWKNKPPSRNHFQITECALLQVAREYLTTSISIHESLFELNSTSFPITATCNESLEKDLIRRTLEANGMSNYEDFARAVEYICDTNRIVDLTEPFTSEAHFDDESFEAGALRIKRFLLTTRLECEQGEFELARVYFARLLHGLQDFYSHSNYVEFESTSVNEKLGKAAVVGAVLDKASRACMPCFTDDCKSVLFDELIKNRILTSGYFNEVKPIGKCRLV
jgi:hypothetical protein